MKPTSILLTTLSFTLLACHPGPAAEEAPAVELGPAAATAPAPEGEVFAEPFVFSIDGMKKINGAL